MTIKVESGVRIPENRGRENIYPWNEMRVGDSFLVDSKKLKTMRVYASDCGKRHGRKYAVREMDDGVRVWRVA